MSIEVKDITYRYDLDDPTSNEFGIFNISFKVNTGETIGVIGHTGSGKSTLVQHLNGLYLPQKGQLVVDDIVVDKNSKGLKELRRKVGMVFQYPEDQLFEDSVYKDIAFGPKNIGMSDEAIDESIRSSMEDMGIDFDTYKDRSPHDLSGGEKRKVAIASVLAMNPEVLVLDEPTAGLDPKSKRELLDVLFRIKEERNLTVFFVSHNMDDIFLLSDRVLVLSDGRLVLDGTAKEVFQQKSYLKSLGLGVPFTVEIASALEEKGFSMPEEPLRMDELGDVLKTLFKGEGND